MIPNLKIANGTIMSDPFYAERELETRFLGDDMDDACAVAIAVNDPVLVASVALPRESKKAAFHNWRKKQALALLRRDPEFQSALEKTSPKEWQSICNGEISLQEVADQLKGWRKCQLAEMLKKDDNFRRFNEKGYGPEVESIRNGETPMSVVEEHVSEFIRKENRVKSKENLRASLVSVVRDCDGGEKNFIVPGFLAILENGEIGIFRHRSSCMNWARGAGCSFLFCSIDRESHQRHISPGDEARW